MKSLIIGASAAALITASAIGTVADDTSEQTRDVAPFKEVSLRGSMDVEIEVGPSQSVRVIADSRYIDDLQTIVENGHLKIDLKDQDERNYYRNIKEMRVIITVPELKGAGIYGSGDMEIESAKADDFDFSLKGSGDAVLRDFDIKSMRLDLAGSGDFSTSGNCASFDVNLRGSGDISADDFKCDTVKVELRGSGDIEIYAAKSADVSVRGSGDVDVYGNPDKLNSNVRGSGDITRH